MDHVLKDDLKISVKFGKFYVQCWTYMTDRAIFDARFFLDFFDFLSN